MIMKPTTARNILISLLLFLGLSAMGGGSLLIISPSGKLLGGLPLSILEHSPFSDFLIPGIILFLILGLQAVWQYGGALSPILTGRNCTANG
jgi:hypothetical protein